ncbi:alpha-amylase family glycosyl hydrolase [Bacteroidota bacterium]
MKSKMTIIFKIALLVLIILLSGTYACKQIAVKKRIAATLQRGPEIVTHPEWSKNAVIYEVNVRQFSPEGTFEAFGEHLPRLKELGVDIIWLMPIFPIGEVNRKATQDLLIHEIEDPAEREKYLGSAYAIKDYKAVNPEHGTSEDFKALVNKIHELGMYVIVDIAINHSAWDHEWIEKHPEYYMRIEKGSKPWKKEWMEKHPEFYKMLDDLGMTYPMHPDETDWWDTAELNFENEDLRKEFIEIFKFWITEMGIDGYRCDVAHGVPIDFWNDLKIELDKIGPVFMLAEAEGYEYHQKAYDMTYAWELHHLMNSVAQGKKKAKVFNKYFTKEDSFYLHNDYRMQFTSNHDENAWNGDVFERMGDATEIFAVFTYIIPGMPLIYNGQEAGLDKRLRFFEKDTINWKGHFYGNLYRQLNQFKKENEALWNGEFGGEMTRAKTSKDSTIFACMRIKGDNKIVGIFNFSPKETKFTLHGSDFKGTYRDIFSEEIIKLNKDPKLSLGAWQFLVLKEE